MPEPKLSEAELAEYQSLKAAEEQRKKDEPIILQKMEAGLTREQAVQALGFQKEADKIEAANAAKAEKDAKKSAK